MKKLLLILFVLCLAVSGYAQTTVFRIANGSEPESVDPHLVSGVPSHRIYLALFEGLMIPAEDGTPVLGAAESYTQSADGLTWTFKMRKAAVWSDGVAVTAEDVVYSWLRCLNPETAAAYPSIVTDIIKGARAYNEGTGSAADVAIKAVDKMTFQFTTTSPAPYVLAMLIHYGFAIVPKHTIEKYGKDWVKPANFVCNGAFTLKEWTPQDKLVVVKNPKYWDAKNVKLGSVVYYASDDLATTYNMFKNNEADWDANSPPPDKVDEAKKLGFYIREPEVGAYYYEFNIQKKPFNDLRVRKAFSMALDRQELVDKVTKSGEFPAYAYTPPMGGKIPFTPPKGIGESVEEAKKLMKDAGYEGGKGFPTVTLLYNTSARHKAIAEWAQQRWEQILGVKVELVNQEFATYLDTRKDGKMGGFDIARAAWIADYMDPFNFLFMFLSNNMDFNDPRWVNTNYDELVRQANSMKASPERMQLFQEAENMLTGPSGHVIAPIYWYTSQNLIDRKKWGGWSPNPLDQHALKFVYKK
jgi:oligopeptide transport system substrate-binding protein